MAGALESNHPSALRVGCAAASTLDAAGKECVPELIGLTSHSDDTVSAAAAALTEALKHAAPSVARSAATVLGRGGPAFRSKSWPFGMKSAGKPWSAIDLDSFRR